MKKVIYWCEFPEKVDWKTLQKILEKLDYHITIYVPCKDKPQYIWWRQEIKKLAPNVKEVNVWPILDKEDGYWFSGFTEKYNIDKLDNFNGDKIKIDLEMPYNAEVYSFWRSLVYVLKHLFKKGPNRMYLLNKIFKLNKESDILVNEFPLPKFFLKRWGCYVKPIKGIKKNLMCYTSIFPRFYVKYFIKSRLKENKNLSISLGLIGPGILKKEPTYKSIKCLKKDLSMASSLGIKNIAVYSLESILDKENPNDWFKLVQTFEEA
ncbi:hypothetical protein D6777_01470 [Candidatus Woesearchaeota archaeon]|nr:MAG: hypothetical protein D6777_01470 [Candidatus Woesearchaeota archaeon]